MKFVHSFLRRAIALVLSRLEYDTSQTNNAVLLIFQTLLQMLSMTSATQRSVAAMVLAEWACEAKVWVFQAEASLFLLYSKNPQKRNHMLISFRNGALI